MQDEIVEKLRRGSFLSEGEISALMEIATIEDEFETKSGNYLHFMSTIIKLPNDKNEFDYWRIDWLKGYCRYEFENQPYRVSGVKKIVEKRRSGYKESDLLRTSVKKRENYLPT